MAAAWVALTGASGLARAGAVEPLPILGIAHVAFQSSDLEASRAYYTGVLGYEVAFPETGATQVLSFKVNDDQFVKLVAVAAPTADDRLMEVALQVTDVARSRALLIERGLEPTPLATRPDGTRAATLLDPDGHLIAFVEYTPESQQVRSRGRSLGAKRVSTRLWHTGVTVTNEVAARLFYEKTLGCVESWRGGPEGQPTAWINAQLPGMRGDYLEYMLLHEPPTRARLGSMHHICLQVPDIHAECQALFDAGLAANPAQAPRVGRNGRWLFNSYDPDGTRTELMEPEPASTVNAVPDSSSK
jgi:lactoylglutathione lyase